MVSNPGVAAKMFEAIADANINIDMISKASVSTDRTSVGFTFSDNDMPRMLKVLGNLSFFRPPLVSCGNAKFTVKSADMNTGKVFLHKIHLVHLEALFVEMFQGTGLRGEGKGQLVGIQRLVVSVKPLVQLAIFAITQEGVTCVGELSADLMGTAGDQLAFHKGKSLILAHYHNSCGITVGY